MLKLFQSTRPARGATFVVQQLIEEYLRFQSTRPARGATQFSVRPKARRLFQSTRPARGATNDLEYQAPPYGISIHAPREGRDL